jgi:hypothetical protein
MNPTLVMNMMRMQCVDAMHRRRRGLRKHNNSDANDSIARVIKSSYDKTILVLSVDEKSQIQALDRTQPGLPMKKGRAGTMTNDYKRVTASPLCSPRSMCLRARSCL